MPAALQVLSSRSPSRSSRARHRVAVAIVVWSTRSVRYIPNNRVGIVEKLWSRQRLGARRASSRSTARPASSRTSCAAACTSSCRSSTASTDAAGDDPAGQDRLRLRPRRRSRCRRPRRSPRTPTASDFQDVRAFLADGGQRGPQRRILREGTYAINLAQFVVITEDQRLRPAARARATTALFDEMAHADRGARRLRAGRHQGRRRRRSASSPSTTARRSPPGEIIAPTVGNDPADAGDVSQQLPGPRAVPRAPAAGAAASSRCSSKAPTTSTACSRPSS